MLIAALLACSSAPTGAPTPPTKAPAPIAVPAVAKVDLNNATEEQLRAIPGATDRLVHEFMEYRPYVSIRQFRKEMAKYVDAKTIAGFEQGAFVPIEIGECDAATLAQLPGLDEVAATALIAARPFASADAFRAALGAHVTPEQAAAAYPLLAK